MKTTTSKIMAIILTLAAVGQIIATVLLYDKNGSPVIINLGWIILWISAIFGWLPILTFKKYGKVAKRDSYMKTTALVDRGVYAIVRHPQYLAGMLMGLVLILITTHWIVVILGIVVIIVTYGDTYSEEASCIAKFGDAYNQYMKRVPRVNFLLGIIRLIGKKIHSRKKEGD